MGKMEGALREHLVEDHGLDIADVRLNVPWITHGILHQQSCDHREVDLWQPRKEEP